MNQLLDPRFDELVHRLVWGIELFDPVRGIAAGGAIVRLEPVTPRLPRLDDHGTGRFSLTFRGGLPTTLRWVVDSPPRRFVPRRLAVDLAPETILDAPPLDDLDTRLRRTARRITLFPGATYPVPTGATTMRGRVRRAGSPVRWARIEVRIPALSAGLLARAHTDADGEFHAVVGPVPGAFVLPATVSAELTVMAPGSAPDRTVLDPDHLDPHWDLPLETLPDLGDVAAGAVAEVPTDDVAAGVTPPPGHRPSAGGSIVHPIRLGGTTPLPAVDFT